MVTGCATQAKYEAKLNELVGTQIDTVVDTWGYPAGQITAPNGNKVYIYEKNKAFTTSPSYTTTTDGFGTATTTGYGGNTYRKWCKTFLEIDSKNMILKWKIDGNSCKSK